MVETVNKFCPSCGQELSTIAFGEKVILRCEGCESNEEAQPI